MIDATDRLLYLLEAPAHAGIASEATLFCIVDAACDTRVFAQLRRVATEERIVPLYQGETASALAVAAPYLAEPIVDGPLLAWLLDELWDEAWGILLWSAASCDELRAHFRRLSRVRTEDGRVLLFRLYDPRVLSAFLPTCDAAQLAEVFGPVAMFGTTVPGSRDVELLFHAEGAVERATLSLEPP